MAVSTDAALLGRIGPGLIWVTAMLAMLMAVSQLFVADYNSGALAHYMGVLSRLEVSVKR